MPKLTPVNLGKVIVKTIEPEAEDKVTFTQTYSTADKTHAAKTAQALTDNSGGTASQTLAAITGGGTACEDATKNAVASLCDDLNKLRDDHLDVAQLLNALIDELQTRGLIG